MKHITVAAGALALAATILYSAAPSQPGFLAPTGGNFPLAGGNLGNQRYSYLQQIDKDNINELGGAWTIHLNGGKPMGNVSNTPVVVDGVMYVPSGGGDISAINAATGAEIWRFKSKFGNQPNRGVAVAEGKVFSGAGGSRLIALDQKTGELAWETKVAERGPTPGAVIYFNGMVFCGIGGGEAGTRGQFGAYDAKTGKEVWLFHTIPGPGEFGHDTWAGDSWTHGGGPLWTQPAVDPDLGIVYVPVGNASPDQAGDTRPGDNLFTASILALDVKTGKYKWHYQEVHHDMWDYDNPLPPVLADITFNGQPRKILIHGGKTGLTYILDRVTGKPLVGIEERPVPVETANNFIHTQPFPMGDSAVPNCPEPGSVAEGARSGCVFSAFLPGQAVVTSPGTQGGINWAPITFSPDTGLFYVPGSLINSQFDTRFGRPPGQPRFGTLTAMDPATNHIVWQVRTKYPLATGSGLLSTATGILFNGESDGNLVAYDMNNGDVLWKFQTGAGADAPVVTYAVNGAQYLAIMSTGNTFQMSQSGDILWAFRIGGTVPPAAAPTPPPLMQPVAPARGGRGPVPAEEGQN
jgi:alcohol dehydrogenase (cytochrome c)